MISYAELDGKRGQVIGAALTGDRHGGGRLLRAVRVRR